MSIYLNLGNVTVKITKEEKFVNISMFKKVWSEKKQQTYYISEFTPTEIPILIALLQKATGMLIKENKEENQHTQNKANTSKMENIIRNEFETDF